jgi:tetratricopeptide (TPR) repeat protein
MARGSVALLTIIAGTVACEVPENRPPRATDLHERCDDADGKKALEAAREAIARGDHEAALPYLQQALAACPENVRTHLLYVETAEHAAAESIAAGTSRATDTGPLAEVRRFYAESDDGRSPVWPYMQARLASHDAAREELLHVALARDPSFYWAYLSWARILRFHRRIAKALDALDNALIAWPDFAEARLERAEVLVELGRYEEAKLEYANYVRQRPGDRAVLREYARLLIYELGETQPADRIVQKMLEDDPDDTDALMNLAALDWRGGRAELAAEHYHRVLELDPTQARAVLNLGNLYYQRATSADDDAEARELWRRAREAYLYFLSMQRTDDRYDVWDYYLTVPLRLRQIETVLGARDGRPPSLADF